MGQCDCRHPRLSAPVNGEARGWRKGQNALSLRGVVVPDVEVDRGTCAAAASTTAGVGLTSKYNKEVAVESWANQSITAAVPHGSPWVMPTCFTVVGSTPLCSNRSSTRAQDTVPSGHGKWYATQVRAIGMLWTGKKPWTVLCLWPGLTIPLARI